MCGTACMLLNLSACITAMFLFSSFFLAQGDDAFTWGAFGHLPKAELLPEPKPRVFVCFLTGFVEECAQRA